MTGAGAGSGHPLDAILRRGAVLRVELDSSTLDDPDTPTRAKFIVIVNALLPDDTVWFFMTTSQTDHFDQNPRFEDDILRWVRGEYAWCSASVTVVDCTQAFPIPAAKLRQLYNGGLVTSHGVLTPKHLAKIDVIAKASRLLSPEMKRWIVPW